MSPGRLPVRLAKPAFLAACDRFDPAAIARAAQRYVADDHDVKTYKQTIRLDRWLADGNFEAWVRAATDPPPPTPVALAKFAGPPEVRAAVVAIRGEAFAVSYLDRAAWDADAAAIVPATGMAFEALRALTAALAGVGVQAIRRRQMAGAT